MSDWRVSMQCARQCPLTNRISILKYPIPSISSGALKVTAIRPSHRYVPYKPRVRHAESHMQPTTLVAESLAHVSASADYAAAAAAGAQRTHPRRSRRHGVFAAAREPQHQQAAAALEPRRGWAQGRAGTVVEVLHPTRRRLAPADHHLPVHPALCPRRRRHCQRPRVHAPAIQEPGRSRLHAFVLPPRLWSHGRRRHVRSALGQHRPRYQKVYMFPRFCRSVSSTGP